MIKKFLTDFLLISLFNYLACTPLNVARKEEKIEEIKNGTFKGELYLVTTDNNRYHFEEWNYHIKNDTLHGNGFEVSIVGEIPFQGTIPVEKISYFEYKKVNALATTGLIVGIAAATILILGIIWSASLANALDSQ